MTSYLMIIIYFIIIYFSFLFFFVFTLLIFYHFLTSNPIFCFQFVLNSIFLKDHHNGPTVVFPGEGLLIQWCLVDRYQLSYDVAFKSCKIYSYVLITTFPIKNRLLYGGIQLCVLDLRLFSRIIMFITQDPYIRW